MLEVKSNFKNMHTNLLCRLCKTAEETQDHVLFQCPQTTATEPLNRQDLYQDEDMGKLKQAAAKIEQIIEHLKSAPL